MGNFEADVCHFLWQIIVHLLAIRGFVEVVRWMMA